MSGEERERILEAVCDICHWPYVYRDDEVMHAEKCDHCPIEALLNGKQDKAEAEKDRKTFLNPDEAISILKDEDQIHTFRTAGNILLGADWDRDELIEEIRKAEVREIAGQNAQAMKHGLCIYSMKDGKMVDCLFVETDMDKLAALEKEKAKS